MLEGEDGEAATAADREQLVGREQERTVPRAPPARLPAQESLRNQPAAGLEQGEQQLQACAIEVACHDHDLEATIGERPPSVLEVGFDRFGANRRGLRQCGPVTVGRRDPIAGSAGGGDMAPVTTGEVEQPAVAGRRS